MDNDTRVALDQRTDQVATDYTPGYSWYSWYSLSQWSIRTMLSAAGRFQSSWTHQNIKAKVGQTMFNDLNNDILEDIFKYLTLAERLKYEGVNNRWAVALDGIWRKMKTIDSRVHPFICENKRVFLSLLMRCPNLRNLRVFRESIGADMYMARDGLIFPDIPSAGLGRKVAKWCPRIEHVMLDNELFVRLMVDYLKELPENHLKHISFGPRYDLEFIDEERQRIASLLALCPHLTGIFIILPANAVDILQPILTNLKLLLLSSPSLEAFVESIASFGRHLAILHLYGSPLKECSVLMVASRLSQLKEINIMVTDFTHIRHLKDLKNLASLHIEAPFERFDNIGYPVGTADYAALCNGALNNMLQGNGRKLKILSFVLRMPSFFPPLASIAEYCPDLERLEVRNGSHSVVEFEALSRLKKLDELTIISAPFSGSGLAPILAGCPHLEALELGIFEAKTGGARVISDLVKRGKVNIEKCLYAFVYILSKEGALEEHKHNSREEGKVHILISLVPRDPF